MICCSHDAAATAGGAHGDHCASDNAAWCATSAAAFARRSASRSSTGASGPPLKSLAGLPPTFTRSKTVLLYWLELRSLPRRGGACATLQSTGGGVSLPPVPVEPP